MDDTDRRLMILLYEDPRMSLRDMAKRLGISRQAVHHRMVAFRKIGLFKQIRAEISNYYIEGVPVAVFGRSRTASIDMTLDRLGESEFTTTVDVAGGNDLFIFGYLRNISELQGYVEFVKKTAEMPEPTVGIPSFGDGINPIFYDGGTRRESYRRLSPIDIKIVASLQEDARKPIVEIAKSVGLTAKTVRRHLERMRSEGSLDFGSSWDIPEGVDMVTMLHVMLRRGADKVKTARKLLSIDPVHFIYLRSFSNLPDVLVGLISSDKMTEIRGIIRKIADDGEVLSVTPNLIYQERRYRPWDVALTADRRDPSQMVGPQHLRRLHS